VGSGYWVGDAECGEVEECLFGAAVRGRCCGGGENGGMVLGIRDGFRC
jgi:hypothetical protein